MDIDYSVVAVTARDTMQAVEKRLNGEVGLLQSLTAVLADSRSMDNGRQVLVQAVVKAMGVELGSLAGWLGDAANDIPCPDDDELDTDD